MIPSEYFIPWLVSNIVSIALVASAIKWPRVTRWIFVGVFVAAGIFNMYTAFTAPQSYLAYADTTILPLYHRFIAGEFSQHATAYVVAIAIGQMLVAVLLSRSGRLYQLGTLGGIIFLIAITPLGIGSAVPAPLFMAAALAIIERARRVRPVDLRPTRIMAGTG